jgi:hypothetical protein
VAGCWRAHPSLAPRPRSGSAFSFCPSPRFCCTRCFVCPCPRVCVACCGPCCSVTVPPRSVPHLWPSWAYRPTLPKPAAAAGPAPATGV